MTKSELRKIYLERQIKLSTFEKAQKSKQIADNFFRGFRLDKIKFLHCFIAIDKFNEINTSLIFEHIWSKYPHIQTFVPKVHFETDEIESLKFTAETKLTENIWQIYEPATGETVETAEFDVILVPLLCFDKQGFRVGFGKGFYDKFLSNCRKDCLKIGFKLFRAGKNNQRCKRFRYKTRFLYNTRKYPAIFKLDK